MKPHKEDISLRLVELPALKTPPPSRRPRRPVGIVAESEQTIMSEPVVGFDLTFPSLGLCPSKALTNQGGAIGSGNPVQLLFWGSTWQTLPDPSNAGQLLFNSFKASVQSILAGPWISGLRQYGIRRCPFRDATIITSPNPPATFSEENIQNVIESLIDNNHFPEPDEPGGRILYFVMMPPGTVYGPGGARGAHSYFNSGSIIDRDIAWYSWIGNQSLPGMSSTFCHELAEMCTDPELNAWRIDGVSSACEEIGDLCNAVDGPLNGVNVESYWSIYDGMCLIPTAWSVKRTLAGADIHLNGQGLKQNQGPIPSMNHWIVNL